MALTSIGAIFATDSKLLQRVYIPHIDDTEINQQFVAPGESIVLIPLATYLKGGAPAVQQAVGPASFSGRCAVVDGTNIVIDHLTADPALYSDRRGKVIPSDVSNPGDFWDGAQFTRHYIELDSATGKVVGSSTQPILSAVPQINAANHLITAAIAPSAIIGASVPAITAQIAARASTSTTSPTVS